MLAGRRPAAAEAGGQRWEENAAPPPPTSTASALPPAAPAHVRTPAPCRLGAEGIIAPADIEIAPDTMVERDLVVIPPVSGRLPRSWTEADRLLLVVKVLSTSTARVDRVRKRALYARVRFPEYWIVDVDARVVERWRPDDERPEVLSEGLEWRPDAGHAALTIDPVQYFAEVVGAN